MLEDDSDEDAEDSDELFELAENEHPRGSSSAARRTAPSKGSNDDPQIP
jgi:hypothetical protein